MKKLMMVLSLVLCLSLATPVFAEEATASDEDTMPISTFDLSFFLEAGFTLDTTVTRGMAAAALWWVDGQGHWGASIPYDDVDANAWYVNGVYWASVKNLMMGYKDNTFAPERPISREELAVVVYRYAQYTDMDLETNANILSYIDFFDVSEYAIEAMVWMVDRGLMPDVDGATLHPQGTLTCAEILEVMGQAQALLECDT